MPKIEWKMRILRKKYAEGLERGLVGCIYKAYTKWNRQAYRVIIRTAPESRTPSTRWPRGFVSSHIKLVPKRHHPYSYEEVDVPGKYSTGSRAWRAWLIIKTLHEGWKKLPFERRRTRKKGGALAIPYLVPGQTLYRKKVVQRRQITLNPWIKRAWVSLEPNFAILLDREIKRKRKIKRKEEIRG